MVKNLYNQGRQFENDVASVFIALGASIEKNAVLAGSMIDLVIKEVSPSGSLITTVVECKLFNTPVGREVVFQFGSLVNYLRQQKLTDKAMIIAKNGFSQSARIVSKDLGVELIDFGDLERRAIGKNVIIEKFRSSEFKKKRSSEPKKVFVVMPFAKEFEDIYILGIREVAEKLGLVVERADDIEHNEGILDIIKGHIKDSDAVVAETTGQNPNVFYEIGYSHAINKPTILISRSGEKVPFDLISINHIFYEIIIDLRPKLEKRLKSTLSLK